MQGEGHLQRKSVQPGITYGYEYGPEHLIVSFRYDEESDPLRVDVFVAGQAVFDLERATAAAFKTLCEARRQI
jgi:hypothetical protein